MCIYVCGEEMLSYKIEGFFFYYILLTLFFKKQKKETTRKEYYYRKGFHPIFNKVL